MLSSLLLPPSSLRILLRVVRWTASVLALVALVLGVVVGCFVVGPWLMVALAAACFAMLQVAERRPAQAVLAAG